MSHHVDDVLLPFVLGVLSEAENNPIEVHVQSCARCGNLLAQVSDDVALLAMALPPVMPPTLMREGLLHALGEVGRFTDMLEPLMKQLKLARHDAEVLLDDLDSPSTWNEAATPGLQTYHVPDRPGACFMRVAPGHPVFAHPPVPSGSAWLLQGSCRDGEGHVYRVGQKLNLHAEDEPEYVALPGPDLLCLVIETSVESPHRRAAEADAHHPAK